MSANNYMTISRTTDFRKGTHYTLKVLDADTGKPIRKTKCQSLEEAIKLSNVEMDGVEYGLRRVEV